MSRSERRKAGVAEKPKTYVMTDAQIKKIRDDAKSEMFLLSLAIPVLVLSDKFGFDEDKLSDFISPCLTWMKCVNDGDAKLSEIVEECERLANTKFTKKEATKCGSPLMATGATPIASAMQEKFRSKMQTAAGKL